MQATVSHGTRVHGASVPMSPDVAAASITAVDPALIRDVTDARRRLDSLALEVIALLGEVRALEDRVVDVAEQLGTDASGLSPHWQQVSEVTGAGQLAAQVERILAAYPLG